tara:strand:- start:132 stop:959 length:828 start_codon:yes stop_codon:yes gene_type:complete
MNEILEYTIHFGHHSLTVLAIIEVLIELLIFCTIYFSAISVINRSTKLATRFKSILKPSILIIMLLVGSPIIAATLGINVTAFLAFDAAILLGLGIGFKGVFTDIISGYVLHFEGTVNKDDIIELDGNLLTVKSTNTRSMRFVNLDGEEIIIPNSKVAECDFKNLEIKQGKLSRITVDVSVAYESDVDLVQKLLIEAMTEPVEVVSDTHPPIVLLDNFGNSALDYRVLGWIQDPWQKFKIKSHVRTLINDKFYDNGIVIPFPQRDLHIVEDKTKI